MQLVKSKQTIDDLDAESGVGLIPIDPEDMWHANNLISTDDVIRAHAVRKVVLETKTGSTSSERVHTDLTIRVTSTFFDPAASALHVSGTVIVENNWVNIGQYHTLDLELHRAFTIWKKYGWDSVAKETLQDALKQDKEGAVAAVVMQEGIANICIITSIAQSSSNASRAAYPRSALPAQIKTRGCGGSMKRHFPHYCAA